MNSQVQIDQTIQFQTLTEEYLEQAVYLTYMSFKTQNPLWNKVDSTYEEMRAPIASRISLGMANKTVFIALKDEKVISCITMIDLGKYRKQRTLEASQVQPKLLTFLTNIQENYIKAIDKEANEKECIYGVYGAVDPKYSSSVVFFKLWTWVSHEIRNAGYKRMYGFVTNPRMFQIIKGLSNSHEYTEVAVSTNEYPEFNGYKLYFINWEFTKCQIRPSL